MKLRNKRLIGAVAWAAARIIRTWIGSVRFSYHPIGPDLDPRYFDHRQRYIYSFWHETMLMPAYLYGWSNIHVLISRHADGQLIARIIERLGFKTVRGSTTRGGTEAVREMLRILASSHVAITPDGPRGPRRIIQPGIVYLASRTGLPVVPYAFAFDRPWRAKSWDRMVLPRPFSRAVAVSGDPLYVPADADQKTLEKYRLLLQEGMDVTTTHADSLIEGRNVVKAAA